MVLVEQLDDAKQLIIDSAKHKSKVLSRIVTPQTQ